MKFFAWLTLTCFTYSFIIHQPAMALTALVQENAAARQLQNQPEQLAIPARYGRITSGSYCGSQRLVVYVQDLHCNPEVQKNIASILGLFDNRYGINRIYLEGAPAGKLDTSLLGSIPSAKIREKTIDGLLKKGLLGGGEYYALKFNQDKLYGLEEWAVYRDNLDRYRKLTKKKEANKAEQKLLLAKTDALKAKYLDRKLKRIEKVFNSDRKETRYLRIEKLGERVGQVVTGYPNLSRYIEMIKLNRTINYTRLNGELTKYVKELQRTIPMSVYMYLTEKMNNPDTRDEYYRRLAETAKTYSPRLERSYPSVSRFFTYLQLNYQINPIHLVEEERLFQDRVMAQYAERMLDRDMIQLSRLVSDLNDYAGLSMTPGQYRSFRDQRESFKMLLRKYFERSEVQDALTLLADEEYPRFYAVNFQRNGIFVKTITENQGSTVFPLNTPEGCEGVLNHIGQFKTIDCVIAGGFHLDVAKLLQDKNVSYLMITPSVAGKFDGTMYEQVMTGKIDYRQIITAALAPIADSLGMDQGKMVAMVGELVTAAVTNRATPQEVMEIYKKWQEKELKLKDISITFKDNRFNVSLNKNGDDTYVFGLQVSGEKITFISIDQSGSGQSKTVEEADKTWIAASISKRLKDIRTDLGSALSALSGVAKPADSSLSAAVEAGRVFLFGDTSGHHQPGALDNEQQVVVHNVFSWLTTNVGIDEQSADSMIDRIADDIFIENSADKKIRRSVRAWNRQLKQFGIKVDFKKSQGHDNALDFYVQDDRIPAFRLIFNTRSSLESWRILFAPHIDYRNNINDLFFKISTGADARSVSGKVSAIFNDRLGKPGQRSPGHGGALLTLPENRHRGLTLAEKVLFETRLFMFHPKRFARAHLEQTIEPLTVVMDMKGNRFLNEEGLVSQIEERLAAIREKMLDPLNDDFLTLFMQEEDMLESYLHAFDQLNDTTELHSIHGALFTIIKARRSELEQQLMHYLPKGKNFTTRRNARSVIYSVLLQSKADRQLVEEWNLIEKAWNSLGIAYSRRDAERGRADAIYGVAVDLRNNLERNGQSLSHLSEFLSEYKSYGADETNEARRTLAEKIQLEYNVGTIANPGYIQRYTAAVKVYNTTVGKMINRISAAQWSVGVLTALLVGGIPALIVLPFIAVLPFWAAAVVVASSAIGVAAAAYWAMRITNAALHRWWNEKGEHKRYQISLPGRSLQSRMQQPPSSTYIKYYSVKTPRSPLSQSDAAPFTQPQNQGGALTLFEKVLIETRFFMFHPRRFYRSHRMPAIHPLSVIVSGDKKRLLNEEDLREQISARLKVIEQDLAAPVNEIFKAQLVREKDQLENYLDELGQTIRFTDDAIILHRMHTLLVEIINQRRLTLHRPVNAMLNKGNYSTRLRGAFSIRNSSLAEIEQQLLAKAETDAEKQLIREWKQIETVWNGLGVYAKSAFSEHRRAIALHALAVELMAVAENLDQMPDIYNTLKTYLDESVDEAGTITAKEVLAEKINTEYNIGTQYRPGYVQQYNAMVQAYNSAIGKAVSRLSVYQWAAGALTALIVGGIPELIVFPFLAILPFSQAFLAAVPFAIAVGAAAYSAMYITNTISHRRWNEKYPDYQLSLPENRGAADVPSNSFESIDPEQFRPPLHEPISPFVLSNLSNYEKFIDALFAHLQKRFIEKTKDTTSLPSVLMNGLTPIKEALKQFREAKIHSDSNDMARDVQLEALFRVIERAHEAFIIDYNYFVQAYNRLLASDPAVGGRQLPHFIPKAKMPSPSSSLVYQGLGTYTLFFKAQTAAAFVYFDQVMPGDMLAEIVHVREQAETVIAALDTCISYYSPSDTHLYDSDPQQGTKLFAALQDANSHFTASYDELVDKYNAWLIENNQPGDGAGPLTKNRAISGWLIRHRAPGAVVNAVMALEELVVAPIMEHAEFSSLASLYVLGDGQYEAEAETFIGSHAYRGSPYDQAQKDAVRAGLEAIMASATAHPGLQIFTLWARHLAYNYRHGTLHKNENLPIAPLTNQPGTVQDSIERIASWFLLGTALPVMPRFLLSDIRRYLEMAAGQMTWFEERVRANPALWGQKSFLHYMPGWDGTMTPELAYMQDQHMRPVVVTEASRRNGSFAGKILAGERVVEVYMKKHNGGPCVLSMVPVKQFDEEAPSPLTEEEQRSALLDLLAELEGGIIHEESGIAPWAIRADGMDLTGVDRLPIVRAETPFPGDGSDDTKNSYVETLIAAYKNMHSGMRGQALPAIQGHAVTRGQAGLMVQSAVADIIDPNGQGAGDTVSRIKGFAQALKNYGISMIGLNNTIEVTAEGTIRFTGMSQQEFEAVLAMTAATDMKGMEIVLPLTVPAGISAEKFAENAARFLTARKGVGMRLNFSSAGETEIVLNALGAALYRQNISADTTILVDTVSSDQSKAVARAASAHGYALKALGAKNDAVEIKVNTANATETIDQFTAALNQSANLVVVTIGTMPLMGESGVKPGVLNFGDILTVLGMYIAGRQPFTVEWARMKGARTAQTAVEDMGAIDAQSARVIASALIRLLQNGDGNNGKLRDIIDSIPDYQLHREQWMVLSAEIDNLTRIVARDLLSQHEGKETRKEMYAGFINDLLGEMLIRLMPGYTDDYRAKLANAGELDNLKIRLAALVVSDASDNILVTVTKMRLAIMPVAQYPNQRELLSSILKISNPVDRFFALQALMGMPETEADASITAALAAAAKEMESIPSTGVPADDTAGLVRALAAAYERKKTDNSVNASALIAETRNQVAVLMNRDQVPPESIAVLTQIYLESLAEYSGKGLLESGAEIAQPALRAVEQMLSAA